MINNSVVLASNTSHSFKILVAQEGTSNPTGREWEEKGAEFSILGITD